MGSPLFYDENLEELFYNESPKWDMIVVYFEGDPIYEADCEGDEIQLYEKLHLERFHKKGDSEGVDFETILIPSCLDDSVHP